MKIIKLLIFDHDMTVVDSSYAIMEGFNFVARSVGLPEVSHELTMKHIAEPIPEYCKSLLGDFKPEWVELYRSQSDRLERELIKPFPDTIPTLEKLRALNKKLAMASNRENPVKVSERTGLIKYFDLIAGAVVPFGKIAYKPDPEMLNRTLEYFDIPVDEAVYIGDSEIDIQTALNAKMRPIGITTGNYSHEAFKKMGVWRSIDNLSELLDIVQHDGEC